MSGSTKDILGQSPSWEAFLVEDKRTSCLLARLDRGESAGGGTDATTRRVSSGFHRTWLQKGGAAALAEWRTWGRKRGEMAGGSTLQAIGDHAFAAGS